MWRAPGRDRKVTCDVSKAGSPALPPRDILLQQKCFEARGKGASLRVQAENVGAVQNVCALSVERGCGNKLTLLIKFLS